MSGLLALLDDVAAIAKVAAASIDDVAAQAGKAGVKAAGLVIDDAAVAPKYVTGMAASRELPMIWQITKGSIRNKIVILLPILMILNYFAPWIITPLLMLGGLYLCFEGAEKVLHWVTPHDEAAEEAQNANVGDPMTLERERVQGAITTDFILSAEIMVVSLTIIEASTIWGEAIILAVVGLLITAAVYGGVALIVKADDVGVALNNHARLASTRALGRGLIKGMPKFLTVLATVGTLAMLWVGGNILTHGLWELGWGTLYDGIHHIAVGAAEKVPASLRGITTWFVTALLDGIFGLIIGLILVPIVTKILLPIWHALRGTKPAAH